MIKRNFGKCQSCGLPYKGGNSIKCSKCGLRGCDECIVNDLCHECFIKAHSTDEINNYFSDKYEVMA